jgi:hypothetical protein
MIKMERESGTVALGEALFSTSSLVWVTGGLMPEWGVELCFERVRTI